MKRRFLKIGDYIVLLLGTALIVFLFLKYCVSGSSGIRVEINGASFIGEFSLDQKRIVDVQGPRGITRVEIENGEVWISESPCKEKLCVKMGRIERTGEQIICLPNRVVVEIKGSGGSVDGIAR